jgi:VanZ family protein
VKSAAFLCIKLFMAGRYSLAACVVLCIGYFIAGLWPFNFHPHNRARWSSAGKGLHFEPLAIATSSGSIGLGSSMPGADGRDVLQFSIELLISSESEATRNIHSLIAIYDGTLPENLLAAQWKSSFLVRTPAVETHARRKYREIGVDKALLTGKQRFLAITSGASGTSLYVEGRLAETYPRAVLRPGSLRGALILGSSPNAGHSFTGNFFGLALFNRMLDATEIGHHGMLWETGRAGEIADERDLAGLYLFDPAGGNTVADHSRLRQPLVVPEYYSVIHKSMFAPPKLEWRHSWSDIQDIIINILGFMPFGFFCYIRRRKTGGGRLSSLVIAVLASGIISAAIEGAQAFLPTRSSSMRDLLCNIGGGLIGATAACQKRHEFHESSHGLHGFH